MKKYLLVLVFSFGCIVNALADYVYEREGLEKLGLHIDKVNLNRYAVQMDLGEVTLLGSLENDNMPTSEELVALCKKVMDDCNVTPRQIEYGEQLIAAAGMSRGFGLWELGELFVRTAGLGEEADMANLAREKFDMLKGEGIYELYNSWQSSTISDPADFIMFRINKDMNATSDILIEKGLIGEILAKKVGQAGARTLKFTKNLVAWLVNFGMAAVNMQEEAAKDASLQEAALEKAVMISVIYNAINLRIIDRLEKGNWVVTFQTNSGEIDKTLFDVPVKQEYSLSMRLKRDKPKKSKQQDARDYSGFYKGEFHLTVHHDLTNIDRQFLPSLFFNNHLPYEMWPEDLKKEYKYADDVKPSVLTKEFKMDDFCLWLYKWPPVLSYNDYSKKHARTFYLTQPNTDTEHCDIVGKKFEGRADFCLYNHVKGPHMIDNNGRYTEEVDINRFDLSAHQEAYNDFVFDCGVNDQLSPFVRFLSHQWVNEGHVDYLVGQDSYNYSFGSSGGDAHMVDDNEIFQNLNKQAALYLRGRIRDSILEKIKK